VKWDPLLDFLSALPLATNVHFLVRGWDGDTTAQGGLTHFLDRFTAPRHALSFLFVYFQQRGTTDPVYQDAFGHANRPNGWWQPMDNAAIHLERIMRARVHPPFTDREYYNVQLIFPARTQADVWASSAMCLWNVKALMNWGKGNHIPGSYNRNRNLYV